MKTFIYIALVLLVSACNISEDCIRNSGAAQIQQVDVSAFEDIYVNAGIALVVSEGPDYEVRVEAGSNVIGSIEVKVSDNKLTLTNTSECNWNRSYAAATVFVTVPNLVEIISNTEQLVTSQGVLHFPMLRLYALNDFGGVGTGNFNMDVDNGQLVVQSNNVSGFKISGKTQELLLNFYDGTGRFEGEALVATDIIVFQRGSNDMVVNPVLSLKGNIYGPGNLISKSHPATVEVIEHYTGKLIFD